MKDGLTPFLGLLLCGMLAFVYIARDKRCLAGTPALSENVKNYINMRTGALNSRNSAKTSSKTDVKAVMDKVVKMSGATSAMAAHLDGRKAARDLIPESVFDFDLPVSEREKRDKTREMFAIILSKVRNVCHEGD